MKWLKIISFSLVVCVFLTLSGNAKSADVYSRGDGISGKIALTFDDGPHCKYTSEILDILSEYGVKATFFTIGENVATYPELVQREIAEGHEIGSHTFSHCNIAKTGDRELLDEIYKCENALGEYRPRLFRPPEGNCNKHDTEILGSLGYSIILWSVDTKDWTGISSDKIINTVKNNVCDGDIILFHDFNCHESGTPEALRVLIPYLKSQGYEMVTVSELIEE